MIDEVDLGESPFEEECAQIGAEGYWEQAKKELIQLKRMMEEIWPPPEESRAYYAIKRNPHEFGTYLSLVAKYDDEDEKAADWAFHAEDKVPGHWDDQAYEALGLPKKGILRKMLDEERKVL